MNKLRNWAFALAVTIFVAGATFVESQGTGWMSYLQQSADGAVQSRGSGLYGRALFVGYGTALPTTGNSGVPASEGEIYVVSPAALDADPVVRIYGSNDSGWGAIPAISNSTFANSNFSLPDLAGLPRPTDAIEDPLANDNEMICYRAFLPFPSTVTEAVLYEYQATSAGATDYMGVGIYYDADDGAQLTEGASVYAADGANLVIDVTDVTLFPGWYRFCAAQNDVSAQDWLAYASTAIEVALLNETDVTYGLAANASTGNADLPATTGALTAGTELLVLIQFQSN